MKKLLQKMMFGGVGVVLLAACSADNMNEEMATLDATTLTMTTEDITMNDLVGTWNMHSMTSVAFETQSAVAVDFDQDGNYTLNLLEETNCFDPMYFTFQNDGTVLTEQARLFFNATGEFTCQTTGNYSATYQISGNELTVNFNVNGTSYSEVKTISQYTENGAEYLKVTLTKEETNSAVYVAKDPGTTVASEIQQIEMVYKKQ